jgi:hypothetical protein
VHSRSRSFSQGWSIESANVVSNQRRLRQMNAPSGDAGGRYGSARPKRTSVVLGTRFHDGSEYSQAWSALLALLLDETTDMAATVDVGGGSGRSKAWVRVRVATGAGQACSGRGTNVTVVKSEERRAAKSGRRERVVAEASPIYELFRAKAV